VEPSLLLRLLRELSSGSEAESRVDPPASS
jgi:hypothetical protein